MKNSITKLLCSTLALPVLSLTFAMTAAADEVRKVEGATCPSGWEGVSLQEAQANKAELCNQINTWDIARLSGQSSISGSGYNCEIKNNDTRELGHTLCAPAPVSQPKPKPKPEPAKLVEPNGTYILKSMFRGEEECLEGNERTGGMQGAAFMSRCEPYSGQLWKFEPQENNYYKLRTVFRGEDECFESNKRDSGYMNGSAFMDKCQNVSGQFWKLVPEGNHFRMKSMFRGDDECLESNLKSGAQKGNSFMDKCQNVSGQLWKLEKFR